MSISAHVATHEPERTDPDTGQQLAADADDFVAATLTFASGAVATVSIVWSDRVPAAGSLHLTGPGGTISHHGPAGLFAPGPVNHTPPLPHNARAPDAPTLLPLPNDIEPLPGPAIVAASRRLLRDFERGIHDGTSPTPNFEDGLRTQAILDAARESARSGQVVHTSDI